MTKRYKKAVDTQHEILEQIDKVLGDELYNGLEDLIVDYGVESDKTGNPQDVAVGQAISRLAELVHSLSTYWLSK